MKNRSVFSICLVLYLLIVALIVTEPLGYDPLLLCVFFFFVFLLLYLFLSDTMPVNFGKLPSKWQAAIKLSAKLLLIALFAHRSLELLEVNSLKFLKYMSIGAYLVFLAMVARDIHRDIRILLK